MLYHRLLSSLLSSSFDFVTFWERVGVDSERTFSTGFLFQAGLLVETQDSDFKATSLKELEGTWRRVVDRLDVGMVEKTLKVVYRLRPSRKEREIQKNVKVSSQLEADDEEEEELQAAIRLSLGLDPGWPPVKPSSS